MQDLSAVDKLCLARAFRQLDVPCTPSDLCRQLEAVLATLRADYDQVQGRCWPAGGAAANVLPACLETLNPHCLRIDQLEEILASLYHVPTLPPQAATPEAEAGPASEPTCQPTPPDTCQETPSPPLVSPATAAATGGGTGGRPRRGGRFVRIARIGTRNSGARLDGGEAEAADEALLGSAAEETAGEKGTSEPPSPVRRPRRQSARRN